MEDLKELHARYLKAKNDQEKCNLKIQQENENANKSKLEITPLETKILEIERSLNNAKKGIGMTLSIDELTSLKKELDHRKNRLQELNSFKPIQENTLIGMNSERQELGRIVRSIKDEITDIIANEAAADIVITAGSKLNDLTHTCLSLCGINFKGIPAEYDFLYQKIGEKICSELFKNESGSVTLPKIEQAFSERDSLIEKLA